MDERFIRRVVANCNPEAYLPQNLSLNLLDFIVNDEEDPNSVIVLIHAVTLLYKNRFKLPLDTPNSEVHTTVLFKSCLKKYLLLLAQELDFRIRLIKRPNQITVDNILF